MRTERGRGRSFWMKDRGRGMMRDMGKTKSALAVLCLLVTIPGAASTLQFQVSDSPVEEGGRKLVFLSEAKGRVSYSVSGLGTIKSGTLPEGATAEVRFKSDGVVQFKIGSGKNQESGVAPIGEGKIARVLISGVAFTPKIESAPAQPGAAFDYQPAVGDQFVFRNPYGPAFEKLTTAEKIRMVQTSSETQKLTREEKNDLLGFLFNQKGVEEANTRRFDEAEKSLRTARSHLGNKGRVVSNLAFVTAVQGNEAALAGDLKKGQARLEESLELLSETEDPVLLKQVHSALAGIYTKQGMNLPGSDRGGRQSLFRKALEFDPAQPVALFELGQIAYANYDLADALVFYEASYRASPLPELAALIQKVQTEVAEAGDFQTQDRGSFKISFEGREAKAVADKTRALLGDAQRDIGRMVGLRPKDVIPVVIYSAGQFQNIMGLHPWAGAAFDGKIRLPLGDLSDAEIREGEARIRQIVYHEYTHALIQNHVGSRSVPIWLHEGLAQLSAGETPPVGDPAWVIRALGTGMIPTPSEMSGQFADERDSQVAAALYYVSFSFVRYLIEEEGGWPRMRRVIDRLVAGDSVDQAFQSVHRRSLAEMEEKWLVALERRAPSAF